MSKKDHSSTHEDTAANRLLMSPNQLAEALGISVSHARRLLWDGKIRFVRIGRSVRVPLEAVREYLASLGA